MTVARSVARSAAGGRWHDSCGTLGGGRFYGRRRGAGAGRAGQEGERAGSPWCRRALLLARASPTGWRVRLRAARACAKTSQYRNPNRKISACSCGDCGTLGGTLGGGRALARQLRHAGWRAVLREEERSWGRAGRAGGREGGLTVVPPRLAFGQGKPDRLACAAPSCAGLRKDKPI